MELWGVFSPGLESKGLVSEIRSRQLRKERVSRFGGGGVCQGIRAKSKGSPPLPARGIRSFHVQVSGSGERHQTLKP